MLAEHRELPTEELLQIAEISAILIAETIPVWLPTSIIDRPEFVAWSAGGLLIWLLVVIWTGVTVPTTLALTLTSCLAFPAWWWGYDGLVVSIVGIGVLITTFVLATRLVLIALGALSSSPGRSGRHGHPGMLTQIAAVAQTLIQPFCAIRTAVFSDGRPLAEALRRPLFRGYGAGLLRQGPVLALTLAVTERARSSLGLAPM